jgi:hypothetical protein
LTVSECLKRTKALSPAAIWDKTQWRLTKTARRLRFYRHFQRLSIFTPREMLDPAVRHWETAEEIYEQLRMRNEPRFFFNSGDRERIVRQAQCFTPIAVDAVVAEAERIATNRFYVHGFGEVLFDDRVTWFDGSSAYSDKLLSRHDFIPTLVQAYWYSSERRFAEKAVRFWRDWVSQAKRFQLDNPVDNSIRIQNWLWMFFALQSEDFLEPTDIVHFLSEIYRSGFFIEAHTMYAGNHRIIEALGLWCIGVFFPELKRAAAWRLAGERILLEEMERQVYADGVHMEMSSGYHVFVATNFLKFYILSVLNNSAVPEQFRSRLCKMLDFVQTLRKPDGQIPMLGDADSLSTMDREHREARLLSPACSLLKSGTSSIVNSNEDLVPWYLGSLVKSSEIVMANEKSSRISGAGSKLFANAGYAVMRNGCASKEHYLLVDAGPFGMDSLGHHGHADALSVEICASGKSLVIDPGGYGYVNDRWRQFFRSTRAHNTVQIDGKDQSEMFGVFGTGRTARCKIVTWFTNDKIDFIEAFHDGYQILQSPVIHRRAILFVKGSLPYWIILDIIEGKEEHTLNLLFHLTSDVHVEPETSAGLIVRQSETCSTLIRSLNFPPDQPTLLLGQTAPEIQGWISRATGSRETAPVISFNKKAWLPYTFATLVQPEHGNHKIVSVRPLQSVASPKGFEFGRELVWPNVTDKLRITRSTNIAQSGESYLSVSVERSAAGRPVWQQNSW